MTWAMNFGQVTPNVSSKVLIASMESENAKAAALYAAATLFECYWPANARMSA